MNSAQARFAAMQMRASAGSNYEIHLVNSRHSVPLFRITVAEGMTEEMASIERTVQLASSAARLTRYRIEAPKGIVIPVNRAIKGVRVRLQQASSMALRKVQVSPAPEPADMIFSQRPAGGTPRWGWRRIDVKWSQDPSWQVEFPKPLHVREVCVQAEAERSAAAYSMAVDCLTEKGEWLTLLDAYGALRSAQALLKTHLNGATAEAVRWSLLRLRAAFLADPKVLWKGLKSLRNGPFAAYPGEFKRFYDQLLFLSHPFGISPHGYCRSLGSRPLRSIYEAISEVIAILNRLGYPAFLNSGTLLGVVREGRLLKHDDDVDVAVVFPCATPQDAAQHRADFVAAVRGAGLKLQVEKPSHWQVRNFDVAMDLFPAWAGGDGRFYVWPYCHGDAATDDVLPLRTASFAGVELPLPRKPEVLLAANYGVNWRVPDPSWSFDWPRARTRFGVFISGDGRGV